MLCPGCRALCPPCPGALKLLAGVQRSPHSPAQLPGVGHNPQVFRRAVSQREESGAGSGAQTPAVTPRWDNAAPAGRISHRAGQLNQTLSP